MVFITNLQFLHTGYMVSGFIRNAQDLMFYKNISCPLEKAYSISVIFITIKSFNYFIVLFYCSVKSFIIILFREKFYYYIVP